MNKWHYRTQRGDAGLNRKPPRLKDLGEHSIGILVRELIQNNLDAAEEGKSVTVQIDIQGAVGLIHVSRASLAQGA